MGKLRLLVILIVALLFLTASGLVAQRETFPPPLQPSLPSTAILANKEYLNAQIRNENAQTEYYDAQTKKLDEESQRTLWSKTLYNLPALVTAVGAILAAFFTLFSFIFNYRSAQRHQRDTQFYEALKRFGDGSPATRSSAAGLLAQISHREDRVWRRWHGVLPLYSKEHTYLETALDQLAAGIELESDPVVLYSVAKALHDKVIPIAPARACSAVSFLNWRLQRAAIRALADFFAAMGVKAGERIHADRWRKAPSVGPNMGWVWQDLVARPIYKRDFESVLSSSPYILADNQPADSSRLGECRNALLLAYERLNRSSTLLTKAIADCSHSNMLLSSVGPAEMFKELYLACMNLQDLCLNGAILEEANLRGSHLSGAMMSDADLNRASLVGATI